MRRAPAPPAQTDPAPELLALCVLVLSRPSSHGASSPSAISPQLTLPFASQRMGGVRACSGSRSFNALPSDGNGASFQGWGGGRMAA